MDSAVGGPTRWDLRVIRPLSSGDWTNTVHWLWMKGDVFNKSLHALNPCVTTALRLTEADQREGVVHTFPFLPTGITVKATAAAREIPAFDFTIRLTGMISESCVASLASTRQYEHGANTVPVSNDI